MGALHRRYQCQHESVYHDSAQPAGVQLTGVHPFSAFLECCSMWLYMSQWPPCQLQHVWEIRFSGGASLASCHWSCRQARCTCHCVWHPVTTCHTNRIIHDVVWYLLSLIWPVARMMHTWQVPALVPHQHSCPQSSGLLSKGCDAPQTVCTGRCICCDPPCLDCAALSCICLNRFFACLSPLFTPFRLQQPCV